MAQEIKLPELDEWGTPTAKLPNCPRCGADELGVIHPGWMFCYGCCWELIEPNGYRRHGNAKPINVRNE